ncbi:MAG: hypothetical protein M3Q66_00565 [Chloroflexota bacterium]|nr:hypothetical protein [Chloroflexota bacterium]
MAPPAALVFALVTAGAVAFQLGLALGAPWGSYAMAGRYPGVFPPRMRVAAIVQAAVLAFLALIVVSDAGLALPSLAEAGPWLIWLPVAFSAVSLVLNAITPSAGERRIWVPVAVALLASSLVVAVSG